MLPGVLVITAVLSSSAGMSSVKTYPLVACKSPGAVKVTHMEVQSEMNRGDAIVICNVAIRGRLDNPVLHVTLNVDGQSSHVPEFSLCKLIVGPPIQEAPHHCQLEPGTYTVEVRISGYAAFYLTNGGSKMAIRFEVTDNEELKGCDESP
ncbi:uncharacterized protein LOC144142487 [Haemaphysalis longicornis]